MPGHNQCSAEEILTTDSLAADWSESEVHAFIANCFDRDVLLKTLLGYASNWLSTRMIAVVTRTGLQPFLLEGWPDDAVSQCDLQHMRTLRAPLAEVENLLTIAPTEATGLQPLFELLSLPSPELLAVQPVQVANKTILLLLGAPGTPSTDDVHPKPEISSLNTTAQAVGNQLGEVISRAKGGTLPAADERIPALPRPLVTRPMSALVVEELTSALLTQSENISSRIDDGWLDMLEDPKPTKTQTTRRDETANDQSPVPAPLLHGNQKFDENPSHTLEMFPDALLDLEAPGKTITHGFESLSQDLSEAEQAPVNAATPATTPTAATVSQHNTDDSQARPAHTLELFVLDAHLQDHDSGKVTDPNKTLSGGFEAIRRDSGPQPESEATEPEAPDAAVSDTKNTDAESNTVASPEPEPQLIDPPQQSSVPDARILRRRIITPRSFDALKRDEQEPAKTTDQPAQQAPAAQEPEPPAFDLEAYKNAFPGQLLIDRYQHTAQTMPPAHEHGPLLAELVKIGTPALDLIRTFLNSNSLELRFYAVLLLSDMPVHNMLEDVVERLFDRDQQIRMLAQKIVLNARLDTNFERVVIQRLRHEILSNYEELRVEVAAEIIGTLQDAFSIPLLIEALGEHRTRTQLVLQQALMRLTFQNFSPSISEWRHWWQKAQNQPRTTWLVDALDSPNEAIRHAAFKQTQQIPGLNLNYHPDQPQKLRERAQQQLIDWFENF